MSNVDNVVTRMDNIEAAAQAFFTARVVKRSLLQNYDAHDQGELEKGVIMIVSDGEGKYKNGLGMTAKEGTQAILFVCHIRVAETDSPVEIEKAEGALIEEIKSFCKQGVAGMSLKPERFQQSRQLAHPYGWVVGTMRAEPSQTGVH